MKVLFVCTGNTCRSAMAEGIAKYLISQLADKPNIEFLSAGIAAFPGMPCSKNALEVMLEYDIDISSHKATQLDAELIKTADLILAMTEGHKRAIKDYFGEENIELYTLKEYVSGSDTLDIEIDDPYGGSIDVYRNCAKDIRVLIKKVLEKIIDNQ